MDVVLVVVLGAIVIVAIAWGWRSTGPIDIDEPRIDEPRRRESPDGSVSGVGLTGDAQPDPVDDSADDPVDDLT